MQFNTVTSKIGMNTIATSYIFIIFLILAVSAQERPTSEEALLQIYPHITGCVSHDMNTFRCRWNIGTFKNLTEPRDLRMFYYINDKNISPKEWSECPHYTPDRTDECFFKESYTKVWMTYSVQLRSGTQDIVYDEVVFTVYDIVEPDPPIALNWTLLNVGLTGSHFDVMVSWEPPHSADVSMGWMTLQYEVQYREGNSTQWRKVNLEKGMQRSLYGLRTNTDHEVRVRCKMLASQNFGEFSDSIFIHIPTEESRFPITVLLVFAALGSAVILMLLIYSQQQKLMVILLPPIPGPKIKGIDPELLKKGKLAELTSILGGHPDLRPELYSDDPWVEFIDLDMEESNDRLTELDTQCLMERSPSSDGPPLTIGFRDDDSGRASCCDPDLPDPEASPFHPLFSNTSYALEPSGLCSTKANSPVQTPTTGEGPWTAHGREDLYTQVSEVRPTGEVVLTPDEQSKMEKEADDKAETEKENEKQSKEFDFQLQMVNADGGGYTSELDAGKMTTRLANERASQPASTEDDSFVQEQPFEACQSLYFEADRPPIPPSSSISTLPPVSVYTLVEGVDRQNSLLLKPSPQPIHKPVVSKLSLPTTALEGYLTPDQLAKITT